MIPCTHRPPCPGCPSYGVRGISAQAGSLLDEIAAATGARIDPVIEGKGTAFRLRARLAVRGRASSPKLGIFQEGTHRIADIPSCSVHHPAINEAARAIRDAIRSTETTPYADRPHAGLLRYVQIVVERSRERIERGDAGAPTLAGAAPRRVQVVLVANDRNAASIAPLAAAVVERLGDRLHSLWWNGNAERTNTIFGPDWQLLHGDEAVRESIGGADVFFPPGAFGQSNLDLADRLVADVQSRVSGDGVIAELYCGVGAIGLGLAARSREIRFNEVSPHGLRGLELGLDALPEEVRRKTSVTPGDAGGALDILAGASCVIVDPPRKGLEPEVARRLRAERPSQVLYVSCDPASLKRDALALVAGGAFRLERLTPYALFPYTDHVETLAEFRSA